MTLFRSKKQNQVSNYTAWSTMKLSRGTSRCELFCSFIKYGVLRCRDPQSHIGGAKGTPWKKEGRIVGVRDPRTPQEHGPYHRVSGAQKISQRLKGQS